MTGDERYCDILYQKIGENEEKIEVKTMCEVADRLIKKGESKGLQEGKDRERIRIIQKKLEKGMTTEQVAELMELPIEEVERLIGSI